MSRIQGPMTAAAVANQGPKVRENLEILDEGPQQALLTAMIEIGLVEDKGFNGEMKKVQKILLFFEYPQLKQLIYEDDTVPRSFIKYHEVTFSMNEKSNFYKVIDAINNNKYPKADYDKINLFDFIGSRVYTTIEHVPDSRNPSEMKPKITGFSKIGKAPMLPDFVSDGHQYMFYIDRDAKGNVIGNNFATDNYGELPNWVKEKILKSDEAKAYAAKGGKFAEAPASQNGNAVQGNAPAVAPAAAVPAEEVPEGYDFVDATNAGFGYADYRKQGWTNKNLLAQGFLVKKVAAPAPPAPAAEVPAPAPIETPAPATPPPAATPTAGFNPFADDDDDDLPY